MTFITEMHDCDSQESYSNDKNHTYNWSFLCRLAHRELKQDHIISCRIQKNLLNHDQFDNALANLLSGILADSTTPANEFLRLAQEIYAETPSLAKAALDDLSAIVERDPATSSPVFPFLFFRGYHALQCHRLSHWLWQRNRIGLSLLIQSRIVQHCSIDIHPAASIGQRVMFDHGTGIVIGETSVIDDDVSILHDVTLGGTGKESFDRHPKIKRGVLIGAGAKVLGNIIVGEGARVAAGSVVLKDVPPYMTVVGTPAREVGKRSSEWPSFEMKQTTIFDR